MVGRWAVLLCADFNFSARKSKEKPPHLGTRRGINEQKFDPEQSNAIGSLKDRTLRGLGDRW